MAQDLRAGRDVAVAHFGDRLAEAVERKHSQLVVGLDPVPDQLPVELRGETVLGREHAAAACARFCCGVVDAVAPYAVAVKPQSAFFEALGSHGFRALEEVCEYARAAGLLVIADAKRGDIGSTARAYSAAFVEPRGDEPPLADAVTLNPYLGRDSIEPFLAASRRTGAGLFCIVKTSNPGGADVQDVTLSDGTKLWQHVAGLVRDWGEELSASEGCRRSEPSSARPIRVRWPRSGGCFRSRCCCCRASAPRGPARPTSRVRSRAARRARSCPPPAR